MRAIVVAVASAMAFVWMAPADATAQNSGYRTQKNPKKQARVVRKPASVSNDGLCQRDTGTPTSSLNFRNRCDVEEFWNRMNERGSIGDR
jgi:hypothetical protein